MTVLRNPTARDGASLWRLAKASQVLDLNSSYAYLILSKHFSRTCVFAEIDGDPVGFATAYRLPDRSDTLFLWQIAVDAKARGQGLALRMLAWLLRQDPCAGVRYFETTVTPSNKPSTALFHALSREVGAPLEICDYIREADFPDVGHEAENLFRIGPFGPDVAKH